MSSAFTDDAVPEIAPTHRFQWEQAQNAYVLLYPEGMVKLNPSASEILKRCDGQKTVQQIIVDLEQQFQNADLGADVRKFLEVANENGWVRARPST